MQRTSIPRRRQIRNSQTMRRRRMSIIRPKLMARLRLKQMREIMQLLPLLRRKEMIVMGLSTRPSTEKSPIEIRQSIMPLRRKLRIAMQRLQTQRRSFRQRSRRRKRLVRMLILLSILGLLPQKVRLAQMKQPLVNSKRKTLSWKGKSLRWREAA